MPIVRNKSTGALIVVDDNGQPVEGAQVVKHKQTGQLLSVNKDGELLDSFNPATGQGFPVAKNIELPPGNSPDSKVSPNSTMDKVHGFLDEYVRPVLPLATQTATSLIAGPAAGVAMGTGVKYGLDKAAGNKYQSVFDVIPGDSEMASLGNAGVEALANEGMGKAGELAVKTGTKLTQAAERKLLPHLFGVNAKVLPEDLAAAATDSYPRSVGQATGNRAAQLMEQRFGGKAATELANAQRAMRGGEVDKITQAFFPNGQIPAGDINKVTQQKMAAHYFDMGDAVDKKFTDFRKNFAEKNVLPITRTVPNPAYKANDATEAALMQARGISPTLQTQDQIHGPIFLTNTAPLADSIKVKLDAYLGSDAFKNLPEPSRAKFSLLKQVVDNLSERTSISPQVPNAPVKEFEQLKQWRTDIGKILSGDQQLNLPKGTLLKLQQAAGKDIETSVSKYWGNGDKALASLQEANGAHGEFMDTFDSAMKKRIFAKNPLLSKTGDNLADPSSIYNKIANSPDYAKQFVAALGPDKGVAKGAIVGKMFEQVTNDATGGFSPDKMLNALKSPGYKEIFSERERANLENFLRQMRTMRPEDLNQRSLGLTAGRMFHLALPVTSLAAGLMGHGGASAVGAATQAFIEVAPGAFTRNILLNPKYARIAAQLPYKAAGSNEGSILGKSLMLGLQGTRVMLNYGGQEIPAQVKADGTVEAIK